jgi:hypothetical protein
MLYQSGRDLVYDTRVVGSRQSKVSRICKQSKTDGRQ